MNRFALLIAVAGLSTGCLDLPNFLSGKGAATLSNAPSEVREVESVFNSESGDTVATIGANATEEQKLTAAADSPVAGTSISFPPGSLAVATEVSLGEGVDIASTENVSQQLGLDSGNDVQGIGTPIAITAGEAIEATVPFSVSLNIPEAALTLTQGAVNYAVIYKANVVSENSVSLGVIPAPEIAVENGKATFKTKFFGTYQLVKTAVPIVKKVEVAVATLQVSLPAELAQVVPFVADAGKTVEIHGKNFSGQMRLALGDTPVKGLNVMSDVKASFVVPDNITFGPKELRLAQADTTVTSPVITRSADKTGLPLITVDPAGVCSGVKYYDITGTAQVGTRTCTSGGDMSKSQYDKNGDGKVDAVNSADMLKSTYDSNSDGVVDTAAVAASAQSASTASVASYATGSRGAALTAASAMTIPDTASAFDVTGSATISSFGTGSAGREVTLRFLNDSMVTPNTNLLLRGNTPLVAINGTVLKIMGTGSGWAEVSRSENGAKDYVFLGYIGTDGITRDTDSSEEGTWQTLLFDWYDFDSTKFSFNPSTGQLTSLQSKSYVVDLKTYWKTTVQAGDSWSSYCKIGFGQGTAANFHAGTAFQSGSTECTGTRVQNTWIGTGSPYSFKRFWNWSTGFPEGTITVKSSGKRETRVKIIEQ